MTRNFLEQALKQKQLDDLDALLGEFGVEGEIVKALLVGVSVSPIPTSGT